jgi:hypothetical protein
MIGAELEDKPPILQIDAGFRSQHKLPIIELE